MRRLMAGTLAALLTAPLALGGARLVEPLPLQPQSRMWVEGASNVRAFRCKAAVVEADVQAEDAGAVPRLLAAEKAVRSVELRVPVAKLDCANGTMNDHMRKALKAAEHGTIVFRVESYDLERTEGGVQGTLAGTLSLGGAQRSIRVAAVGSDAGEGALRVTGAHELAMSEYGLKAPTAMLGTLKVADRVTVRFDLLLRGQPRVAASE